MNTTPQERVDFIVGLQADARRSAGAEVNEDEIRRSTARLLDIADAEIRRGDNARKDDDGKTGAEVLAKKREQSAAAIAEKAGGEFFYGNEREETVRPIVRKVGAMPAGLEAKGAALLMRIAMLKATIPGYRLKPGEDIANQYQYPRFAMMLMRTTDNAMLSDPNGRGAGEYTGLSLADRHRRYLWRLEQICDQSNAAVGRGWWVPR